MNNRTKDQYGPTVVEDNPKDAVETVIEGIEGTDRPMEESHPYAPAMFPLMVYPLVLVVAIIAAVLWFTFR